jgi:hypothetical protein
VSEIPLLVRRGIKLARRRGGRSRATVFVIDHPVRSNKVASRLLLDVAATPPHEEGNTPHSTFGQYVHIFIDRRYSAIGHFSLNSVSPAQPVTHRWMIRRDMRRPERGIGICVTVCSGGAAFTAVLGPVFPQDVAGRIHFKKASLRT